MKRLGLALLMLVTFAGAGQGRPALHRAAPAPHWVGSWATPQQLAEAGNALPPDALRNATLRQVVHLSLGGKTLRLRLSNLFGTAPLHIAAAHIARPLAAPGGIAVATDRALTFSGRFDVTIPAGADMLSDPVAFTAPALSDLAITLLYDTPPPQQTSHPGARATSFYAKGDFVSAAALPSPQTVEHWFQIEGVDVLAAAPAAAVVVLGDSITDGRGSTTDGNDRWTDALARRLQASPPTRAIGVLNKGIGGNRLLLDGLGPSALARFDRDVIVPPGVRWLIVLEGVNDLAMLTRDAPAAPPAHAEQVAGVLVAYEQIVARAHAHGIKVFGATILPYKGNSYYHADAANEADRQTVNAWIRAPGHFDAVLDFDAALRNPAMPDTLLPRYDVGDHLHPGPAGYQALADSIPLSLFARPAAPRRGHRK